VNQLTPTQIKLAKARTSLVLAHPFIGSIALNMKFILDETIDHIAKVDGKSVWFRPSVVDELADDELQFLVAHECFHPMLEHNYRLQGRDPKKWNQAGDYVINELLTLEKIGRMPEKYRGLQDSNIYAAGNGSTDGIYNIIPESNSSKKGGGAGDGFGEDIQYSTGTAAEQEALAQEMRVMTAQAAQAARMAGNLSKNMERFVDEILNPKVLWTDVLERFLVRNKTDQRTFARPSRRFISNGLYLPTISGESMGEIAIAVDCSGSITDKIIAQFAAEITRIKEDMMPTRIHVLYFDSAVSHVESYVPDDTLDIRPHGGGGTAFSPVMNYMAENGIEPVACVFLTDLCCDDFGDQPNYPVLWVSTERGTAPWGEVILM